MATVTSPTKNDTRKRSEQRKRAKARHLSANSTQLQHLPFQIPRWNGVSSIQQSLHAPNGTSQYPPSNHGQFTPSREGVISFIKSEYPDIAGDIRQVLPPGMWPGRPGSSPNPYNMSRPNFVEPDWRASKTGCISDADIWFPNYLVVSLPACIVLAGTLTELHEVTTQVVETRLGGPGRVHKGSAIGVSQFDLEAIAKALAERKGFDDAFNRLDRLNTLGFTTPASLVNVVQGLQGKTDPAQEALQHRTSDTKPSSDIIVKTVLKRSASTSDAIPLLADAAPITAEDPSAPPKARSMKIKSASFDWADEMEAPETTHGDSKAHLQPEPSIMTDASSVTAVASTCGGTETAHNQQQQDAAVLESSEPDPPLLPVSRKEPPQNQLVQRQRRLRRLTLEREIAKQKYEIAQHKLTMVEKELEIMNLEDEVQ